MNATATAAMSIDQRRANAAKFARVIEKKYELSGPQLGILRTAARKYKTHLSKEEHNGEVETYNVRQDTLNVLIAKGLIHNDFLYSEDERARRVAMAEQIKIKMFETCRAVMPNDHLHIDETMGSIPAWKLVYRELERVAALLKGNMTKVIRITDAGRAVAEEFKFAIGAEEE